MHTDAAGMPTVDPSIIRVATSLVSCDFADNEDSLTNIAPNWRRV